MDLKLKDFKPREYQDSIFKTATSGNTLVVLPTGLGKTAIAVMLAIHRLKLYPKSKIVLFAPTKPLVDQHLATFKSLIDLSDDNFAMFTGTVRPEKRLELWKKAKIILSTPQGFENDIISNKLTFKDVSLVVFDECHRAVKDYSYVYLSSEYYKQADNHRILALTASPGSDNETVMEVLENLFIDKIEFREVNSLDVKPYVQETKVEQIKLELPVELIKLRTVLYDCFKSKLIAVKQFGYLTGNPSSYNKSSLLKLQAALYAKMKEDKSFEILKSVSLLAEAGKIQHAIELAETQSIFAVNVYLKKLEQESLTAKTKAVKNLVKDPNFRLAKMLSEKLLNAGIEHPKLGKLQSIMRLYTAANKDSKVIIFTQFRDSAIRIKEFLDKVKVSSELFFGQAKKNGIGHSQKVQKQIIQDFKNDKFPVLIATSVAEEGLDIPSVDLVIFYEAIPSAIRTVQRRGRTGRHAKGRIITLITKNTRDEAFKWVSYHKEKRMYRIIEDIKKKFELKVKPKKTLASFPKELSGLKIYVDYREKGNKVLKVLSNKGVLINLDTLNAGDFLLSDRTVVEFKLVEDFVSSIIDKRLFEQATKLKRLYENKIIIIQGDRGLYSVRRIHPNAIMGALASLLINFNISVIHSKDAEETAGLLIALAKREQEGNAKKFVMHSSKPLTIKQQQEFVVSSFPGIGSTLNLPLLKHFGCLKEIVSADEKELMKVDLVGKIKAKRLFELFNTPY